MIQDYFENCLMKIDAALHKFFYNREKMAHDIFIQQDPIDSNAVAFKNIE